MASNPQQPEERERKRLERTISKLTQVPQVMSLLELFQLSLTDEIKTPLLGGHHRFALTHWNNELEKQTELAAPHLDWIAQHLGFVNQGELTDLQKNKKVFGRYYKKLADGTLQDGKKELSRYLTKLRPVLLEYQILLYCTPSTQQVMTEVATAEYKSLPGRPVLNALPTSVAAASGFQQSETEIKQLAPEVSWLIPMLVVYRKIKDADMLLVYLDGWLSYNSPQENEIMLAKLIRYYPIIANDERILAVFKRHIMIT